jgi:hypothetical protein
MSKIYKIYILSNVYNFIDSYSTICYIDNLIDPSTFALKLRGHFLHIHLFDNHAHSHGPFLRVQPLSLTSTYLSILSLSISPGGNIIGGLPGFFDIGGYAADVFAILQLGYA